MSSNKRVKRQPPPRTQPIRNWSAIFAGPGAAAGGTEKESAAPAGGMNDLVSKSVQLGYRVVDEYIRQGQRAAQRVGERSYDPQAMAGELQQMAAQMGRFASDFAALWFELVRVASPAAAGAFPAFPAVPEAPAAAPAKERGGPAGAAPTRDLGRVKVEVASARPAEVTLDLSPAADGCELSVEDLRAVDAKLPPLRGLAFAGAGHERTLRIKVPPRHPAGVYNGLVLDRRSGRPLGTVSVKIAGRARG